MFSAILLAAGRGTRLGTDIPKQYLPVYGKPLLYYPLLSLEKSRVDEVILVTAEDDIARVRAEIVERFAFKKVRQIVAGGSERHHSVYHGLRAVAGEYVLIHDGARALIESTLIDRMCDAVSDYPACVAAVPSKDTIKLADAGHYIEETLPREHTWIIQTPQAFARDLVLGAYERLIAEAYDQVTDDAMVVERYTDTRVKLIEGSYTNFKVTDADDLRLAKTLFQGV